MPFPSRPRPPQPPLDVQTLRHVQALLEERLKAVEVYGAGGCGMCHDAELRGAIRMVREMGDAAGR